MTVKLIKTIGYGYPVHVQRKDGFTACGQILPNSIEVDSVIGLQRCGRCARGYNIDTIAAKLTADALVSNEEAHEQNEMRVQHAKGKAEHLHAAQDSILQQLEAMGCYDLNARKRARALHITGRIRVDAQNKLVDQPKHYDLSVSVSF